MRYDDEAALDFDPVDENHLGLTSFRINLEQEVNGCIYLTGDFNLAADYKGRL